MFIALVILLLIAVFITVYYYYQANHASPVESEGLSNGKDRGSSMRPPTSRDGYTTAGKVSSGSKPE
ncbi:hypothetical protein [Rufibacter sp. DG15C]|uniref:hypothetical protein n=1 Tax=Rufibacter sp. DG15C TaxID=1379909 RepID=UPI000B2D0B55|nr:hypothetical protein [Rufibacter sp. DG15C]